MLEWKKNSAKQKLVVKLFGSFNCYLTVSEMKKLKCSVNIWKCSHILLMISGGIISELSNSSCDQAVLNRTKQQLVLKVLYLLAVWMSLLLCFFFLIQMKITACHAKFLVTFLSIIIFTWNTIFKKPKTVAAHTQIDANTCSFYSVLKQNRPDICNLIKTRRCQFSKKPA